MTAVTPGRVTVPAQRPAPLPAPERRGRTEIADRAVAKIACCAAKEVPEVRDVRVGGSPWTRPSTARVRDDRATLRLNVSMAYPIPLHAAVTRLRDHVIRRVELQTGLEVRRLDIVVTELGGDLAWGG
ncbi:Asp23/Gls24 family envelope stress response protein [Nonomuraea terrae]|uniref:Asp23/Gls24 family envelope stress response protein n=1 Tax=Nonomuraea terrae TaxID=2530383 RepID=A0A4R4YST9_9ACTN|nr:Asp23/Gls24 family envelope stress response protein [Nonomuraea terrae]